MLTPCARLTASVLAVSSTAFAGDPLVWDNGDADTSVDVLSAYMSDVEDFGGSPLLENTIADDFILTQDTFITGLQWTGFVIPWIIGPTHPYRIEFYAAGPDGLTPPPFEGDDPSSTAIATYEIPPEQIVVLPDVNWPAYELHFATDLQVPLEVSAGERYWISIQAHVDNDSWGGWMASTTQQLSSFAYDAAGMWQVQSSETVDLAFKLYGVPVPGAGALALLGIAGLARRRRRR